MAWSSINVGWKKEWNMKFSGRKRNMTLLQWHFEPISLVFNPNLFGCCASWFFYITQNKSWYCGWFIYLNLGAVYEEKAWSTLYIWVNFIFLQLHAGTGVILCIEKALAQSGVSREDVNYINAHATSTPAGDIKEYQALVHCFGQNQEVDNIMFFCTITFFYLPVSPCVMLILLFILQLRVNSTKSMIGHLLGAAGAVEAVATVQVCMQSHLEKSGILCLSCLWLSFLDLIDWFCRNISCFGFFL